MEKASEPLNSNGLSQDVNLSQTSSLKHLLGQSWNLCPQNAKSLYSPDSVTENRIYSDRIPIFLLLRISSTLTQGCCIAIMLVASFPEPLNSADSPPECLYSVASYTNPLNPIHNELALLCSFNSFVLIMRRVLDAGLADCPYNVDVYVVGVDGGRITYEEPTIGAGVYDGPMLGPIFGNDGPIFGGDGPIFGATIFGSLMASV